MQIGTVKFFGKRSPKTGKRYGFVTIADPKKGLQDIYFNEGNVPPELDNRLNPGTCVSVRIVTNCASKNEAVIEEVKSWDGVSNVRFFKDGLFSVYCEDGIIRKAESLLEHKAETKDIVAYIKKNEIEEDKNIGEIILIKKIDTSESCLEEEILERCAKGKNVFLFDAFYILYLKSISIEETLSLMNAIKTSRDETKAQKVRKYLLKEAQNVLQDSAEIRKSLFLDPSSVFSHKNELLDSGYIRFINYSFDSETDKCKRQILRDELLTKLNNCDETNRGFYWQAIKILRDELSYKNYWWDIAPIEKKERVIEERKKRIKQKYSDFFDCVDRFNKSDYPFKQSLSEDWQSLYDFDESDCDLIKEWCADSINTDYYKAREAQMKSARGAEKLVLKFYRDMGYSVKDTSIHQITGESETWKTGDIRIEDENNNLLCDVKNARKSVNSSAYSKFCVPSFKKNRENDVLITAVLSPYLRQEFINGTREPKLPVENPIVLGEFDSKKLFDLEAYFNDDIFYIGSLGGRVKSSYLPPWLFDYNDRFYEKKNEVIFDFLKLEDSDIPDWEELKFLNDNDVKVLPLFIASKRKIPDQWISSIPSWQIDFINSLIDIPTQKITLPYLFLSLLKHFLSMLSCEDTIYSPRQYTDLMYMNYIKNRSGHREFCEPPPPLPYSTKQRPLKLYDPLDIIDDLCKTLEILWDSREAVSLSSFKVFCFNGKGLLKGKRDKDDQPKTILAYCGGQVEQKGNGKCGYKPLIIGKHKNCKSCGCLICPNKNCQYCSRDCQEYQRRKQRSRSESKTS